MFHSHHDRSCTSILFFPDSAELAIVPSSQVAGLCRVNSRPYEPWVLQIITVPSLRCICMILAENTGLFQCTVVVPILIPAEFDGPAVSTPFLATVAVMNLVVCGVK